MILPTYNAMIVCLRYDVPTCSAFSFLIPRLPTYLRWVLRICSASALLFLLYHGSMDG